MGCGSSSAVAPADADGHKASNAAADEGLPQPDHDRDDVSTVVLPDTPEKRAPIAFEIPLAAAAPAAPPAHLARLLAPAPPAVTLDHIEGRLAEAETRRLALLQQRAASAQRRSQKMMRSFQEMDRVDSEHEAADEPGKRAPAAFAVAGLGGAGAGSPQKNIS